MESYTMGALAVAMFVALFAFGDRMIGWDDPAGHVQLALAAAFIFGMICGYRAHSG
jgi:hypothetical protein